MTTNRLLNQRYDPREQDFLEDMIIEAIQAKGDDVKYLIRDMVDRDPLFGESPMSEFKEGVEIEMYLADIQNFNGDGDLFSKFGMTYTDTAVFEVSVKRFREELGFERPREGDLIYYALNDSLYEIKKVKQDSQFFRLGKNYCHRLQCSLFQFSHETLPSEAEFDTFRDKTVVMDGSDSLAKTLGISPNTFKDESAFIEEEGGSVVAFDPSNPFGEQQ